MGKGRVVRGELRMERDVLKGSVVLWVTGDAVSLGAFIADQRTSHRVPYAAACRGGRGGR
ncbi:MAG: hypothetical protein GEV28_30540 [Actinophytocola sp.]|uniref:hypothetical protein n=1 Tax=Actinophytocola sp. TaxID=1872138 RepID=UPI0013219C22|nr:hypothetical protein [Actinophytocola sp.]MPZ84495.1 hypothetical protein [Actinophytocola sp.]